MLINPNETANNPKEQLQAETGKIIFSKAKPVGMPELPRIPRGGQIIYHCIDSYSCLRTRYDTANSTPKPTRMRRRPTIQPSSKKSATKLKRKIPKKDANIKTGREAADLYVRIPFSLQQGIPNRRE